MNPQDVQMLTSIAGSLTTNVVLLMWLYREMKRADRAQTRLEIIHDKTRLEIEEMRSDAGKGA